MIIKNGVVYSQKSAICLKLFVVCFLSVVFSSYAFLVNTDSVFAAQEDETLEELVDALNSDLEMVYEPYNDFVSKIGQDEFGITLLLEEFGFSLKKWRENFRRSRTVYEKYRLSEYSNVSLISNLAFSGAEKGIEATHAYESGLSAETEENLKYYFDQGDELMVESMEFHDEAVDLYNDYSGASDDLDLRNALVVGSVLAIIFSSLLFVKSRRKSSFEADVIRAAVYDDLFKSSLWMSGGLLLTTAGFSYALEEGGTYFILYGPILAGGGQLIRGVVGYFKEGRKQLDDLAKLERKALIKESYKSSSEKVKIGGRRLVKKCSSCGTKLFSKTIVCSKCGENVL